MTFVRRLLIPILSLALLMANGLSLQARVQAIGSSSFTICTGQATKTLTVDRTGTPISAGHVCLDCCQTFDGAAYFTPVGPSVSAAKSLHHFVTPSVHKPAALQGLPANKGPPFFV